MGSERMDVEEFERLQHCHSNLTDYLRENPEHLDDIMADWAASRVAEAIKDAEIERLQRGYVPQDIAQECVEALAPLDVRGEPNTLWALVRKAMRLLSEKDAEIAALRQRVEELSRCAGCKSPMDSNRCEECS